MQYAVYYTGSNMVARTREGAFHIYPTKALAEDACAKLGEGHEVRIWGTK